MSISNAFQQFESILHENMGDAVLNMHVDGVDDPAERMIATMQPLGVGGRQETPAQLWEARRLLKLSRGGMVTGGTWAGNTVESMGASDVLPIGQRATAKAPDPEKVPLTQYQVIKTTLKRIIGNVVVNMSQILGDSIGNSLEELAVGHLEDAVFQVRKNKLAWFYSDGTGMIAKSDSTYTITVGSQQLVGLKAGPYNRFIKGQRYQAYSKTSWPTTTTRKGGTFRCTNISDTTKEVEFEMELGGADADIVVDDIIVLAGTLTDGASATSLVPKGIEYMFKKTGDFFGISDITDFPELMSYVEGSESAPIQPEPDEIAKLINRIKKAGKAPPTMLVSESALSTQYAFTEKAGFAVYPVPSHFPNPNGGVGSPVFTHGTIVMPWEDSEYIRPGMLWGAAPDTIQKFQPGGGDTIRWWFSSGPTAGAASVFMPVADGTQATELMQAPFETHIDYLAIDPKRSFRRIGFLTQETA